jgi:hypothetical protein
MRRSLAILGLLVTGCVTSSTREVILTDKAPPPIASYSQGIVDGGFVFVSGQGRSIPRPATWRRPT